MGIICPYQFHKIEKRFHIIVDLVCSIQDRWISFMVIPQFDLFCALYRLASELKALLGARFLPQYELKFQRYTTLLRCARPQAHWALRGQACLHGRVQFVRGSSEITHNTNGTRNTKNTTYILTRTQKIKYAKSREKLIQNKVGLN